MFLGIDVGGTHTDAVLLTVEGESFTVISQAKIETDHENIVTSVRKAMAAVLEGTNPGDVTRFTLSSTLATNAIAQKQFDNVALVLVPGPGLNVAEWAEGLPVHIIPGAIDHRGQVTEDIDEASLATLIERLIAEDITSLGVAGKFATRNPAHETAIASAVRDIVAPEFISLSHRVSGALNFPRRAVTVYYNAALRQQHNAFADNVLLAAATVGNGLEPRLLMAHGGSVPLNPSREHCAEAANSGPAASALGILALEGKNFARDEAVLFCDIGGSTTDIALMAKGSPVTARDGLSLGGRRTAVPGLATRSVPVGGDSPIVVNADGTVILDHRQGPCLALGGPVCALTDALNVLGQAAWGDSEASLRGMRAVALDLFRATGRDVSPEEAARLAVDAAGKRIYDVAQSFIGEINANPIYTVAQLLAEERITPVRLCVAGGAGASMAATLEKLFGVPVSVPGYAPVANAIGAALARVSTFVTLYADTARGVMQLLPQGGTHTVSQDYSLDQAQEDAKAHLRERIVRFDPDAGHLPVDMVESDSFAMHDEHGTRIGQTIRILCRARPGLVTEGAWT